MTTHMLRNLLLAGAVLLTQSVPTLALAQEAAPTEGQKAKVVSRVYQATYGAQLRCGASPEWETHGKTLERFRSTYPELIQLVDSSPFFPVAKESFQGFLVANPPSKVSEKNLTLECESLEAILRSLIDGPGAREAVAGYVQLLKS